MVMACVCAQVDRAKVLSNTIKQKRKEKAGKWEVPLPKVRHRRPSQQHLIGSRRLHTLVLSVWFHGFMPWNFIAVFIAATAGRPVTLARQVRPIAEDEMFKVMRSGKRQKKQWKRMLTKVTFVGGAFTRKPPKYERFIRPTGAMLRSLRPPCATSAVFPQCTLSCHGAGLSATARESAVLYPLRDGASNVAADVGVCTRCHGRRQGFE